MLTTFWGSHYFTPKKGHPFSFLALAMKTIIQKILQPKPLGNDLNAALLLLRVGVALSLFVVHGFKKVTDFAGTVEHIPDPFGIGGYPSAIIAILANVVAAGLLALGLGTRLAIALILGITLSGLFIVHAADPVHIKDVPYMYSLVLLFLLYVGPGSYSLDWVFFSPKAETK